MTIGMQYFNQKFRRSLHERMALLCWKGFRIAQSLTRAIATSMKIEDIREDLMSEYVNIRCILEYVFGMSIVQLSTHLSIWNAK